MVKQTIKQKSFSQKFTAYSTPLGAWVLAAAAIIGMTEGFHDRPVLPANMQPAYATEVIHTSSDTIARSEGSKETVRMHEEYDVGIRAPSITGRT